MNKENKVDRGGGGRIIKNLAKLKNLKNLFEYQKSIQNSIKFKISKRPNFLSSTAQLAYIRLRQTF